MEPRIDLTTNAVGAKISKRIYNVNSAIEEVSLPKGTLELVALRASQINGCGWCLDIHTKWATAAGETPLRLSLLAGWRHSTVFTEAESAALALTEEGTRIADTGAGVSDETWAEVRKHFDDDQIAALVSSVALINATNRMSVILNYKGGSFEPAMVSALVN